MKIYIHASENKPKRKLTIEIEILAIVEEISVSASEDPFNLPIADKKIAEDITEDYQELTVAINNIIHSFGFKDLHYYKSNSSNSMYFMFCRETEFNIEEVEFIVGMRVSDHPLPMWRGDKTKDEPLQRLQNKMQSFADECRYMNQTLYNDPSREEESIPAYVLLVKYENEWYSTYADMFKKIRKEITTFKTKYEIP